MNKGKIQFPYYEFSFLRKCY